MDFERHREVLDAAGIGMEANALRITSIWANMEAGTITIESEIIPDFLERLSNNIFPDQTYTTYFVNIFFKFAYLPALTIDDLRGNYVKYKEKFYKIPNE